MTRRSKALRTLAATAMVAGLLFRGSPLPAFAQELPTPDAETTHFLEANTQLPDGTPAPESLTDGFAALSGYVDMGAPLEWPHIDPDGHTVQLTSNGLAYFLPDENQPSFTDGWNRYALDDDGHYLTWAGDDLTAPVYVPPAPAPAPRPASVGSPRDYLYEIAPASIVNRLNCIVNRESGWNPNAKNPTSTASGLFQFLNTTWAGTPQGRAGYSVWDPYKNIEAGVWLYQTYGATQWEVVTKGLC